MLGEGSRNFLGISRFSFSTLVVFARPGPAQALFLPSTGELTGEVITYSVCSLQ
jgi:hypothetical protein